MSMSIDINPASVTPLNSSGYKFSPQSGNKSDTGDIHTNEDTVSFSDKALTLMHARQISAADRAAYRDILVRVNSSGEQFNPHTFLESLSVQDSEVVRKVHSLALPYHSNELTYEGATNLLVEPGSAKDIDNNGLVGIGSGYMMEFPPTNSPESVKAAWRETTAGMSMQDIPFHFFGMITLANIHQNQAGNVVSYSPDDPEWRNPFAEPGFSFKAETNNIIQSLEVAKKHIPNEQYEFQMNFYNNLVDAFERHGVS